MTLAAMLLSLSLVAGSANAENVGKTKVRLVAIVSGATIHASGSAAIPTSAATARDRRLVVLFSLSGDGHSEHFQTALKARRRFAVAHATTLVGALRLRARMSENGQLVGTAAVKTVTVAEPPSTVPTAAATTAPLPQPSPTPEKPPAPKRPLEEPHVVPCSAPAMPALEPSMGIVTGYVHTAGGPAPGEDVCEGGSVTLTPCYVTQLCPALSTISSLGPEREIIVGKFGNDEGYAVAVPAGEYIFHFVPSGIHVFLGSKEVEASCVPNLEIRVAAGEVAEMPTIYCDIP